MTGEALTIRITTLENGYTMEAVEGAAAGTAGTESVMSRVVPGTNAIDALHSTLAMVLERSKTIKNG